MKKKTIKGFLLFSSIILGSSLISCGMSKNNNDNVSSEDSTIIENSSTDNNTTGESSTEESKTNKESSTDSSSEVISSSDVLSYYNITFNVDDYVKVYVYETKDMSLDGAETLEAYSRDGDTGIATIDGGQVNFKLVFVDGYELDNINISGNYNKLKGSGDTGYENGYRITNITSDLVVDITSKSENTEEVITEEDYEATFTLEHCTVYIYDTQDTTGEGTLSNVAYARNPATGNLSHDGEGQINFKVVCDENYTVSLANIVVTGTYTNIKLVEDGVFRITKIGSDLIVNIEAIVKTEENDTLTSLVLETEYNDEKLTLNVNSTSAFSYTFENNLLTINSDYENEISLDGSYYGAIKIVSTADLLINLNGVTLRSDTLCPLYIDGADTEISAKKNTENYIYDDRDAVASDSTVDVSSAIYTTDDLKIKGSGVLNVESENNNGIHSKDDLTCQNLTLNVNVCDNALKGNDSVTISSGVYKLISRNGDGIKTSNSALDSNNNQKGTITINGGTIDVYSACDGIDAAYDVIINDVTNLNIYTDKYSEYSGEVTNVADSTYYIRSTTTSYVYSIYYYNTETGEYVWKNTNTTYSASQTIQSGKQRVTYYYYEVDKPSSGYNSMIIYTYSSGQAQGQDSTYTKKSSSMTLNNNYDTIAISNNSYSWTNYSTTTQQGPGGMGMGDQGNTNKKDYSTKGIKASNSINILSGTIKIEAYDDALHANNDEVLESGNTPLGNVNISGGNVTLSSNDDGIHADNTLIISGGNVNVLTAYEGIEANQIYFNGGSTYVYSTDDAVNAAKCGVTSTPCIYMNDGYVDLDCASGDTDTLDSNGNIKITGGVLVVKNRSSQSTSMTGGTIDLDGTLTMTGGIVVSFGTWCTEANLTSSKASTSTISSGTYSIVSTTGETIMETTLSQNYAGYNIISKLSGSYNFLRNGTTITSF